jgi:hypothetical protein
MFVYKEIKKTIYYTIFLYSIEFIFFFFLKQDLFKIKIKKNIYYMQKMNYLKILREKKN